jgi:hypothetical protein
MSLARYFVFTLGGEWLVSLDGTLIGRHSSRESALSSAIVMADLMGSMRHDADVIMEDGGRLDITWTYGLDPLPRVRLEAAA